MWSCSLTGTFALYILVECFPGGEGSVWVCISALPLSSYARPSSNLWWQTLVRCSSYLLPPLPRTTEAPDALEIRCGHVTESLPMKYEQKCCASPVDTAGNDKLASTLSMAYPPCQVQRTQGRPWDLRMAEPPDAKNLPPAAAWRRELLS